MSGLDPQIRVAVLPAAHPGLGRLTGFEGVAEAPDDILRDSGPISDVDVAHLHLGHDYMSVSAVERAMAHLARDGVPVLLTVHDIDHQADLDDPRLHERFGALVKSAARVITLTEAAALRILERWDVAAAIVPHPRLLDESEISTAVRSAKYLRGDGHQSAVGVLLERMGENIEGPELLDKLAPVPIGRPGAELRIVVESHSWHEAVGEDPANRAGGGGGGGDLEAGGDPMTSGDPVVAELAAEGAWESVRLVTYEALDLGPMLPELAALDACVLPYRFASHSTWLELCRDLGVAAVFPDVGFLRDQWFCGMDPEACGGGSYDPGDPGSVARAVGAVLDQPRPVPPRPDGADAQSVMAAHAELYWEVAAGVASR